MESSSMKPISKNSAGWFFCWPRMNAFRLFLFAVFVAVTTASGDASPSATPAPTNTATVAPCEFHWVFAYRGNFYGLAQWGPVGIYRRNTHLIWKNMTHEIPVTWPWAFFIAACVVVAPVGFLVRMFMRGSIEK